MFTECHPVRYFLQEQGLDLSFESLSSWAWKEDGSTSKVLTDFT